MREATPDILAARLANQRLWGPAASTPEQVVGELLAVQSQDAPLARLAIAQRADCHVTEVEAAIDAGRIVRTHILRPTWHYVLRDDLAWLLELTGRRIVTGVASRLQRLGLPPEILNPALDAVVTAVAHQPATRKQLWDVLVADGILDRDAELGMRVTHVLMQAEVLGLIASGPLRDGEHTYAPWDAPPSGRDRDDLVAELVRRFVTSHGPISVGDLMRWVNVTKTETLRALAADDSIVSVTVDGVALYLAPDAALPVTRQPALLLSTFDEAFLSYRDVAWPRTTSHPLGEAPYRWSEAGGGPVLDSLEDVGSWKRTAKPGRLTIRLDLASSLSDAARARVHAAAEDAASQMAQPEALVAFEDGPVPWGVRSPRR